MKIKNLNNLTIDELFDNLKARYPTAEIRKPFRSQRCIVIPVNKMKHVIRSRGADFNTDFTLPVWVAIVTLLGSIILFSGIVSLIYGQFMFGIGGALWILLVLLAAKAIYKSTKKETFNAFYSDVREAITKTKSGSSIF